MPTRAAMRQRPDPNKCPPPGGYFRLRGIVDAQGIPGAGQDSCLLLRTARQAQIRRKLRTVARFRPFFPQCSSVKFPFYTL